MWICSARSCAMGSSMARSWSSSHLADRRGEQLDEALAARTLGLSDDQRRRLDEA
jgi:hypothetical protein